MKKEQFYFNRFDERRPYPSIPNNKNRSLMFQFCGVITVVFGISYIHWRWRYSLNPDALWFAVPLVVAETMSFVSTIMVVLNFWSFKDPEKKAPVHYLSDIEDLEGREDRPLKIDILIATFNEDVELVRYSIIDAKNAKYPYDDVAVRVFVLDDGRRDGRDPSKQNMKKVAEEEGVGYLTRENNQGYKAGNLKNGLEHTDGDLFAILDADTRPFENFLVNTTGYFRNKKVAWVQTPQWFYDTTEAEKVSKLVKRRLKLRNKLLLKFNEFFFGKVTVNEDIFGNDPRLFYDVILRKRNFYNAAFCCGAGSVHRREAIIGLAIKDFAHETRKLGENLRKQKKSEEQVRAEVKTMVMNKDLIPFKFHASEDIYTSIMLHADKESRWESIQHPDVECKMLSTQDLDSWIKQHSRYAEGSLDIAIKDNPLFIKGLTFGQKMCYFITIWSYFAPLWNIVFILSPLVFFFTLHLPVKAYSFDFIKYFLPFQVMNTIMMTIGAWGIETKRGDQYYISGFWYMLMSIVSVIRGKKVKFNVTPKDQPLISKNTIHVLPHFIVIGLGVIGIIYNLFLLKSGYHPSLSGFAANTFWCIFNITALGIMIRAAYWKPLEAE